MGTDLYLLFIMIMQIALVACFSFFLFLFPSLSFLTDFLDGAAGIVTVTAGTCLVFLFAEIMKNKGVLSFDEDGSVSLEAVFKKNRKMNLFSFAVLAALIFVMQFANSYVLGIIESVLNIVGLTAMNSPASNADYSLSITLLLYAVLIGPAAEELIFRGFVLRGLRPCGRVFSVLISSVLFSLMHGDIQQIYFTFVVGIILGYTASEYSIWASFLLHVFNNGFISMFITYGLSGLPDFLYYLFTGMMLVACIAVLVIAVISGGVESAEEFFTRDKIEREAVMGLINPWFIVFVIFCAAETLFSLSPLS